LRSCYLCIASLDIGDRIRYGDVECDEGFRIVWELDLIWLCMAVVVGLLLYDVVGSCCSSLS
ncbi:hypothetical protein Tco_1289588, partial [Tanacetum coccineum]